MMSVSDCALGSFARLRMTVTTFFLNRTQADFFWVYDFGKTALRPWIHTPTSTWCNRRDTSVTLAWNSGCSRSA